MISEILFRTEKRISKKWFETSGRFHIYNIKAQLGIDAWKELTLFSTPFLLEMKTWMEKKTELCEKTEAFSFRSMQNYNLTPIFLVRCRKTVAGRVCSLENEI